MATINQLPLLPTLIDADQFLVWSTDNGDSRRVPYGVVKADITLGFNSDPATLTNKTIALGSNTLSGTLAQFDAACTDANFASTATAQTLTNKTFALGNNTLTGTLAQFNAACTDADFATQADIQNIVLFNSVAELAPAYVETLSTGLFPNTPANVSSTLQLTVTGTAGSSVLTTTETAKVAGFGSTTLRFETALISNDGEQLFFASCISNNGSTQITLRQPLEADFVGVLSPKYSDTLGQHLSENGTRAYAQHVATQTGLFASRGRILNGSWLNGPSSLQTAWVRNAALIAYGIVNSAAPIVQTSFQNLISALNIFGDGDIRGPTSLGNRGSSVGTHLAGHGMDGTFYGRGKNLVLELWTSATRSTVVLSGVAIRVTVSNNGDVIYDETAGSYSTLHRIPIMEAGTVSVSITNTDGQIYNLFVMQTTLREAGIGGKIIKSGSKIVCLGDSWFEFYGGLFATTLSDLTGATTINRALGGQTTEWALAWFDEYVASEMPDACIFHFFTNDANNLSGQTFVAPDGSLLPKWPSGLTDAQSQALWRGNLNELIQRCQQLGIRPIIINAGGTASNAQMQKHANWSWAIDRSAPVDWVATPAQTSDVNSFINNFGKSEGVVVSLGETVRYASGALPADAWTNPLEEALVALQQASLSRATYSTTPSFSLGVDSDSDGISDGLVLVNYGVILTNGETLVKSIASGAQRYTYSFTTGNTGNSRLGFNFSLTATKEYLFIFEVANAATGDFSLEMVETVTTGSTVVPGATVSKKTLIGGVGPVWFRGVANATVSNRGVALCPDRLNGVTRSLDITSAYCIDLNALFAVAPNAATFSNDELVAFVRGLQP
jgi:hypothetical protein